MNADKHKAHGGETVPRDDDGAQTVLSVTGEHRDSVLHTGPTALLLSGGMDSLALAWWLKPEYAFTVDYGQAAAQGEIRAAAQGCAQLGIRHEILSVDASALGSGDLAGRAPLDAAPVPEWWPFRNQFLLTVAGMRAVAVGVRHLVAGSVSTDQAHRDGTAAFYADADRLFATQEGGVRVSAPAIAMTTAALVQQAGAPRDFMSWAHSCHTGTYACGTCRGCWKQATVEMELWGHT